MFTLTADFLRAAGTFFHNIQDVLSLPLAQRCGDRVAVRLHGHHRAILHTLVQTAAASGAIPNLAWGPRITLVIRAHWKHRSQVNTLMTACERSNNTQRRTVRHLIVLTAAVLSHTVRGVGAVQDGSTAAHALLSDEGAGALLVILPVQTGAAGAGAHTWLILLTGGTSQRYRMTGTQLRVSERGTYARVRLSLSPYGRNCGVSS